MIALIFSNWRLLAVAAGLLAAFAAGWLVNGWRAEARIGAINAATAQASQAAEHQSREREQVLAAAIAQIDQEKTDEQAKFRTETETLRAAVAAGTARLRVAARCPAANLPGAAAGSGLGDGAAPDLDADAGPAYFALRAGLDQQSRQLMACQSILAQERGR